MKDYIILAGLWSTWCAIHSGLISLSANAYFKKRLGSRYKFFRLFYNLAALATLLPMVAYSRSLTSVVLFRWEGNWFIVQAALLFAAIVLFVAGGRKYDLLQFIGVRQIRSGNSHATLSASGNIDASGVLGLTRHPWYLAAIMLVWSGYHHMTVSTFIVNIILTIYLVIGTILEERKLTIELGERYRRYKKEVSMLLPIKWICAKLSLTPNQQ